MKLSLFFCFVLCCATLVSSDQTWKEIRNKLQKDVQPYTDFVHVVSSHNQVTSGDFQEAKRAAVLLNQGVNKLGGNIGYYYSRIAFFQFSRSVYYEYRLSWYQNLSYVQKRINDIPRRPGNYAAVGNGLNATRDQFRWSSHQENKVAWLVTNRYSEVGANATKVADQLKAEDVKVFVIGIGQINRWKELKKLATRDHAFAFDTYNDYRKAVWEAVKNL